MHAQHTGKRDMINGQWHDESKMQLMKMSHCHHPLKFPNPNSHHPLKFPNPPLLAPLGTPAADALFLLAGSGGSGSSCDLLTPGVGEGPVGGVAGFSRDLLTPERGVGPVGGVAWTEG